VPLDEKANGQDSFLTAEQQVLTHSGTLGAGGG
jgi:hypothetical protein